MNMKSTRLCRASAEDASNDPVLSGIGFDPISLIISLLLPIIQQLFTNCFPGPDPTPASTKEHLVASYSGESSPGANDGQYDHGTLAPATRHAMHIAKQHGHTHHNKLTQEQAQAIAIHTLDNIRNSDDDIVQEAMSASA